MKKRLLYTVLVLSLGLSGCLVRGPETPHATEPIISLEKLVDDALAETQQAEQMNFSPAPPYSPLDLAALLVPGDLLGGKWQPSTVYDLTQPYPPMEDICGGYYGSCWPAFSENKASYGAELELLHESGQLGEAALLYFEDSTSGDAILESFQDNWSDAAKDGEAHANDLWLHFFNPFDRPDVGEQWLHKVGFSEWRGPDQDPDDPYNDWELLRVELVFKRCHMLVLLDLRFEVDNPWDSPEDNLEARAAEQEERFNLVYEYAQAVDERITPYACSP